MRRILLVIEDFQELSVLQGLLMKFGWDIKAVRRDRLVKDELMNFSPEAIIASARGKAVDGIALADSLRMSDFMGPYYLIVNSPSEIEEMDASLLHGIFMRPMDPRMVVRALATHSQARQKTIVEKYEKIFGEPMLNEAESQQVVVGSPSVRQEKYDQYLKSVENLEDQPWDASSLRNAVDKIRAEEKNEENDLNRKEFVKKLFDG